MPKRVSVPKSELEKIREKLKNEKEMTIEDISKEIGADFRNHLYKTFNFDLESFENLEELYSGEIKSELIAFRNGVSYEKRIESLEKNSNLAEFIGIILGDGNIRDFHTVKKSGKHVTNYKVTVSLHQDQEKIIRRVKELFSNFAGRAPGVYSSNNGKSVDVYIYSKDLVEELKRLGLESGDKKENQVGVPQWVKQNKVFEKACLKGLVDTDGAVYRRSHDGYNVVQFKNASHKLLQDFREMCEDLDISASNGGHRTVQIAAQDEFDKFIRLIDPIKDID